MRKIIFEFDDSGMVMKSEGYVNEDGKEDESKISLDDAFDIMSALAYLMKQNGVDLEKAFAAVEATVKAVEEKVKGEAEESFEVQGEEG